ncbi:MAG: hypothetical protein WA702_11190, partial [Bradyrhizobium sp.]|uniref:hypothetical protein n=1 Tax=Bradyrhizobium sp. TaxID=376 RepID=UPI003C79D10F
LMQDGAQRRSKLSQFACRAVIDRKVGDQPVEQVRLPQWNEAVTRRRQRYAAKPFCHNALPRLKRSMPDNLPDICDGI